VASRPERAAQQFEPGRLPEAQAPSPTAPPQPQIVTRCDSINGQPYARLVTTVGANPNLRNHKRPSSRRRSKRIKKPPHASLALSAGSRGSESAGRRPTPDSSCPCSDRAFGVQALSERGKRGSNIVEGRLLSFLLALVDPAAVDCDGNFRNCRPSRV
jgi:hypothetical protein